MQDRPVCLRCDKRIDHDPVFEAPCGHDRCPSAVFHGLCLMEWREARDQFIQRLRKRFEQIGEMHVFRVMPLEDPDA